LSKHIFSVKHATFMSISATTCR